MRPSIAAVLFSTRFKFIYRGALEIMVGPTREVAPSATLSSVTLGSDASRLEVGTLVMKERRLQYISTRFIRVCEAEFATFTSTVL